MSHSAQLEYLKTIYVRYQESNKLKKSKILDEFCEVCGVTRKHAIRLLKKGDSSRIRSSGPKVKYAPDLLLKPIKYLWRVMGRVNSKKLKAAIPDWLKYIETSPEAHLFTSEIRALLSEISASSLERLLKKIRWSEQKGKCSTRPNKRFMKHIPIQAKDWNVAEPGHVQADTVAHCGDSLQGSFIFSLTVTDIYSGWTENRATWNKGMDGVTKQLREIENRLPFALKVFKSDSGTEFMNHTLQNYLLKREHPVKTVRSRPYRKDDNCYVEQKNNTHVRELFGYERLKNYELTVLMNEVYSDYWNPLQNFFIPSTKLLRKTRIGAHIKKEFEPHKTPYQRVIESSAISDEQKQKLSAQKEKLNPYELSKALEDKLREFFKQVREIKTRTA